MDYICSCKNLSHYFYPKSWRTLYEGHVYRIQGETCDAFSNYCSKFKAQVNWPSSLHQRRRLSRRGRSRMLSFWKCHIFYIGNRSTCITRLAIRRTKEQAHQIPLPTNARIPRISTLSPGWRVSISFLKIVFHITWFTAFRLWQTKQHPFVSPGWCSWSFTTKLLWRTSQLSTWVLKEDCDFHMP